MKKKITAAVLRRLPWLAICAAVLVALAAALLITGYKNSNQAHTPTVPDVVFEGEYRVGEGEWKAIRQGEHISATKGEITLRGVFSLYSPETGELLPTPEPGIMLSFYLDHLAATITDAKGVTWVSDNENRLLGEDACARVFAVYELTAAGNEGFTVTLQNPHALGNETAVDSFLGSVQLYTGGESDALLREQGATQRGIGVAVLICAFILLGIALFSAMLHIKAHKEMWLIGLLVLFAGLYFVFSAPGIGPFRNLFIQNTRVLGLSFMLYMLTVFALQLSLLSGRARRVLLFAALALVAATLLAILLPLLGVLYFYDTYPAWLTVAVAVCLLSLFCLAAEARRTRGQKLLLFAAAGTVVLAFVLDVIATLLGLWKGGAASGCVFLLILVAAVVFVVRFVPKSIQATEQAKEIWVEKQAMEVKLQESRISIMLSQIQPHFLYNTLNSIYGLCVSNPLLAQSMVNSFSEYLRNNLSSLDEPGLIPFETELSHIKTYLDIEKIRFDDTLEIEYDIGVVNFSLPVLTVQPIVENAVKHGTSKKRGGGTVRISTREEQTCYVVTVSDTGRGFDTAQPLNDGKRHVGIENVRQRLFHMCGGTLTIESEVGVGTVVTIKIPKGGASA